MIINNLLIVQSCILLSTIIASGFLLIQVNSKQYRSFNVSANTTNVDSCLRPDFDGNPCKRNNQNHQIFSLGNRNLQQFYTIAVM